jgi:hypothetical protein
MNAAQNWNNTTYPDKPISMPQGYEKTCDIFMWVSFVISSMVFFILIFVVLKKSPKVMRS